MNGSEFNKVFHDTLFAVFSDSPNLDITSNNHLFERINLVSLVHNTYIYIVKVPDDCIVTLTDVYERGITHSKYISTKLIMNRPVHKDYFEIVGNNYALDSVKYDCCLLQYIKHKTPEICLAAVQTNGFALKFVKEQTPEICLAAVSENWSSVCYVDNKFKYLFQ